MEEEEAPDSWGLVPGSRAAAAAIDMKQAVESGEREMTELRAMLARKGVYETFKSSGGSHHILSFYLFFSCFYYIFFYFFFLLLLLLLFLFLFFLFLFFLFYFSSSIYFLYLYLHLHHLVVLLDFSICIYTSITARINCNHHI